MRIGKLLVLSFRGIDALELDLNGAQTTLLYGANGCGKSAVLDCVAVLLSQVAARAISDSRRGALLFSALDVRTGAAFAAAQIALHDGNQRMDWAHSRKGRVQTAPLRAGLSGELEVLYHRFAPGAGQPARSVARDNGWAHAVDASLRRAVSDGRPVPVLSHYPTDRAVLDIPLRIRGKHEFGAVEALGGGIRRRETNRFRLFFEWFRNREDHENEGRREPHWRPDAQLQAVRTALESVLEGYRDFRVVRRPSLRMECHKHGEKLRVDQLSDGEKCLLALIGDLARRLAIANPDAEEPLKGQGIVLIDEIDLHLHPAWQRKVIGWLERTFPNCQFILSTHSPQVLSSVRPDQNVFLLREDGANGVVAERVVAFGRDTNTILRDFMGVSKRPEEIAGRLEGCYRLIDEGRLTEASAARDELESLVGPDDPDVIGVSLLIRRREALGG